MSSPLAQGRIVWVTVPDPRGGNPKARPGVIVTPTAQISTTGTVTVAAITTLIGQTPFAETVEVPSDPAGHPQTRLKKPSEVVCT
jgi:mRNA-degrading endonuclease toxin of MazEF toxin-antitoxin module